MFMSCNHPYHHTTSLSSSSVLLEVSVPSHGDWLPASVTTDPFNLFSSPRSGVLLCVIFVSSFAHLGFYVCSCIWLVWLHVWLPSGIPHECTTVYPFKLLVDQMFHSREALLGYRIAVGGKNTNSSKRRGTVWEVSDCFLRLHPCNKCVYQYHIT